MINHRIEAEAIKKALAESQRVLVIGHKRPDGDTLGSVCAWVTYLTSKGKEAFAFCLDPVPNHFRHLPGSELVTTDQSVFEQPYDVIIVNDAGDLEYAGIAELLPARTDRAYTLINIDHHATNPRYGDINIVIDNASSTTEVVARLMLHWGEEISKPMADCLLNGIITDTSSMTNPATSYRSLAIAAELMHAGADIAHLAKRALYTKSVDDLKLWGLIMSRLRRNHTHNIAVTYVTQQDVQENNITTESLEGLANYLILMADVQAILVLQELPDGHLKGSLRSVSDDMDVSRIASYFGGGGHKKSAGFRIRGRLQIRDASWTVA